MTPTFKINGHEYVGYVLAGGIVWERRDIESGDSGVTLDGKTHKKVLASKSILRVSMGCMDQNALSVLTADLAPTEALVEYIDPRDGVKTALFNSGGVKSCAQRYAGGEIWYDNVEFELNEV